MKRIITTIDLQRNEFVKNLYANLRKETKKAINEKKRFTVLAKSYVNDGLEKDECVELLILDGLEREAANRYVDMIADKSYEDDNLNEYEFTFEDVYGKICSSHEIHRTIKAASNEEAWEKAEEFLDEDSEYEPDRIISVEKLD